jgi:DNA repair exonuclease SbcCD ATPase subunit
MPAKPTEKNTKAEILTAYNQLAEEKKTLETQLKTTQKQSTTAIATPPIVQQEPKAIVSTTPTKDKVNYTIASLDSLQLGFGTAVSELSEKLTTEAAKLAEIRESVAAEIIDLQTLHNLEVTENTFEELIASYETSSKAFGEELRQRQETYQQEIQTQTKAWQKEQEQHEITFKERVELERKNLQREVQEYQYNLDLQRKIDREQYEQQQANLARELAEIKEVQEKAWAEREQALAEREKQFSETKDKVAAFAQDKETAIKKAKEEGKGIATYQAKIKSDLYAKDVEGQKRFYEGRIASLEDTISNQGERLNSLSKQLEAALKQVQDLAVKAIEGSANANSYQTLKEITLEQAKSQAKTK